MSRELKFRIWDHAEKCFFYDFEQSRIKLENGNRYTDGKFLPCLILSFMGYLSKRDKFNTNDEAKRWGEIQLFTGLMDSNNKPIYEGDICECTYDTGRTYYQDVSLERGAYLPERLVAGGMVKYTVVGNIFQNGDLIK